MKPASSTSSSIALITPPFFLNDFRSPYLAMPHLAGFLRASGVNDLEIVDANMAMWRVLRSVDFLRDVGTKMNQRARMAPPGSDAEREALFYYFLLQYVSEDPSRLVDETSTINMYAGIIFDMFYADVRRSIPAQIEMAERGTTMPRLQTVVDEVVGDLSRDTALVAITVPTADQFLPALLIAKAAKQRFSASVTVALGGCIFSLLNRIHAFEVLKCPYVDCIGVHEGELTMLGLAQHVREGRPLAGIPNLLYRWEGQVRATEVCQAPPLNDCPEPYFPEGFLGVFGPSPRLPVWASRGCYWGKCTFCDYVHLSANNNKAETIRVFHLVDEIELLSQRHHTAEFEIITECLSPSFCRRLSKEILKRNLEINWTTHIKVEKAFDPQTCHMMAKSGCRRVTIGVESFNDRQLEIMKKGCTHEDIVGMLTNLREANISSTINIIVDFPSIEDNEAEETLVALETYRHLYGGVNVFPFVLSLLTDIADAPAAFGVKVRPEMAEEHNRGFHFAQFERVSGMTAAEATGWLRRYQLFSYSHKRRLTCEAGLYWLSAAAAAVGLRLCAAERFLHLDAVLADRLVAAGLCAPFSPESEVLLFDLERKQALRCVAAIAELHRRLREQPIFLSELGNLVLVDEGREGQALLRDLLVYGIKLGLLTIEPADRTLPPLEVLDDPPARRPLEARAEPFAVT